MKRMLFIVMLAAWAHSACFETHRFYVTGTGGPDCGDGKRQGNESCDGGLARGQDACVSRDSTRFAGGSL